MKAFYNPDFRRNLFLRESNSYWEILIFSLMTNISYRQIKKEHSWEQRLPPLTPVWFLVYLKKLFSDCKTFIGEECAINIKKKTGKRYLDDCFIFLKKSLEDLQTIHKILNSLHSSLQFTIEISEKELPF